MSKKLIFCDMNPANEEIPVYPLGICLLAGIAVKRGWEVKIKTYQEIEDENDREKLHKELQKADLIAISIRNLDNTEGNNPISFVRIFAPQLHYFAENFKHKAVLGGAGFSIMPERVLDEFGFLYGMIGRGGPIFTQMLFHIENGGELSHFFFRRILSGENEEIYKYENLNQMWPVIDEIYDEKRKLGFDTHIGCGGNCIYCTYPYITEKHVEYRSEEEIKTFIEKAYDHKIRKLQIVDDVFNNNLNFAKKVCRAIAKVNRGICLSCYLSPNVDLEFAMALKAAGFKEVIMGIDSLSDDVLKRIGKAFSERDIRNAELLLKRCGIEVVYTLIVGSRFETKHTLEETKTSLMEHLPDRVTVQYGIRVYPNTRIHDHILEFEEKDLLYPYYDTSNNITQKDFECFKLEINKKIGERKML